MAKSPASRLKQWGWFIALWLAGVLTLATIGGVIKLFL